MQVKDLLKRQKNNNSLAIKCGDLKLTYVEWDSIATKISQIIIDNISSSSWNIGLLLPNSIEYAKAYFAVQYIDRVLVPISVEASPAEVLSTVEYCEIDLLITNSQYINFLKNTLQQYHYKMLIYNIDTSEIITVNENKQTINKTSYITESTDFDNRVAIMLHTSGTMSNPKRVMLTHKNIICNVESNIESLRLTEQDKVLIALPMMFGYCNTAQFLTHVYLGASMVIMDSVFFPKRFFQLVEKEKITNFTGVPTMLLMLLDYKYSDKYDHTTLRYICFGGGKMPNDKLRELINKYGNVGFVQTYGQTECSPRVTALLPEFAISKLGSVGTPIPRVKIRIENEHGIECKTGEKGEVLVSGENIMKGYYKRPDITHNTIRNGWIHTGDIGYTDNDGFLYLTGRIKNIIISGGINIYPEEIEQVLLQHENVAEVCVYGEEHFLLGEVPVGKILLKKHVDPIDLRSFCLERLSAYKVPTRFEYVDEMPKTYNGKIKRMKGENK